ncbi:MAG: Uma2 family endonuclease [Isosphaeraceae bacterium]
MNTTTTPSAVPIPRDGPPAAAGVPSLDEIYQLTAVPDDRVVFHNVDWSFYERLIDSIPESSNIHVDYDGKDLEVMGKGRKHERRNRLLGRFVDIVTAELEIPRRGLRETTWKRPEISRGLEADECYYFLPEKIAADNEAIERGSDDIADYPNPDLAIEVDISPPRVDRAGIYAALRVAEVWRFANGEVVIERLTAERTYVSVEASQFLPVRADEVRRWVVEEDSRDELAWEQRLREYIRGKQEP